ncbi:hypothetical protein SDC9_153078 [bioreactor metagenome]|uniref:HTH cro/C1-type domain-containing protein n=1 Tax=bioreactor metagenome TaxID=1076179 RepID=A0A645EZK8_9ZZZZ
MKSNRYVITYGLDQSYFKYNKIKKHRDHANLKNYLYYLRPSYDEAARITGINKNTLVDILNNRCELSDKNIKKINSALNIDVEKLLESNMVR